MACMFFPAGCPAIHFPEYLNMKYLLNGIMTIVIGMSSSVAHDSWVETNVNFVRTKDVVYVMLKLGNHGNDHRDFKLAGKVDPAGSTLMVISASGRSYDLLPGLIDEGYTPKEGYLSARFVTGEPGLHMVVHTSDHVVSYAPKRSVKSAKTFFVSTPSLDNPPADNPGFDKALGHALELTPLQNPVTPMGPGQRISFRLDFRGKPLSDARVSFIPRGTTLSADFDAKYEKVTSSDGVATFEPTEGNVYLVVAHHEDPNAAGDGYTSTKYSATIALMVPEICPCCGE